MIKYYAYGSNISLEQMRNRVGFVLPGVPHVMHNYELVFDAGSKYSSFVFCNIKYTPGKRVEGLIYELEDYQLRFLDQYEALYRKQFFYLNGEKVFVYICRDPIKKLQNKHKPTLSYLNTILDGCLTAGLKGTYNELLEYKNKNYKLKRGSKHKNLLE